MAISADNKVKKTRPHKSNCFYNNLEIAKKICERHGPVVTRLLLRKIILEMKLSFLRPMLANMRARVDSSPPAARPHVALKLKKARAEQDRVARVQRANYDLLKQLDHIMVDRLADYLSKPRPLPRLQQKVGLFYDVETLNRKLAERAQLAEEPEESYHHVKCYACEMKKKQYDYDVSKPRPPRDSLPSIYSN